MWAYDLVLLLHLISAVLLVALLGLALRHRREPAAPWFCGVCAALLLWTVGYIIELGVPSLGEKLVWANLQCIGSTALPALWLLAVRTATGRPRLPNWLTVLVAAGAVAIIVCAYTNPYHLFRGTPTLDLHGPFPLVDADYRLLFYAAWVPYAYGLFTIALLSLGQALLYGPRVLRARWALLFAATALPMMAGGLYIAGVLPWPNFNPAIAAVSFAALIAAYALIYGRLFDVTPLARELVLEQLCDGVLVCDERGRLCDCNTTARALLPELHSGSLGHPLPEVLAGRPELLQALAAARRPAPMTSGTAMHEVSFELAEQGIARLDWPVRHIEAAAHPRHLALSARSVCAPDGRRLGEAIVLHDITGGVHLLNRARRLASTDELTGLLMRRRLLELGRREIERARRDEHELAVLLLDVDHFKAVNDRYGHLAGDELLRAVAAVCRTELRSYDLLARYGGDELAAVLPGLDWGQAEEVAERLRAAIACVAVDYREASIRTTVSIGVACGGRDGETLSNLIEAADAALYRAKSEGRNRVTVTRLELRAMAT